MTEGERSKVNEVLAIIGEEYNVGKDDLIGKSLRRDISEARQMAMYILREEMLLSIIEISEIFGRDHSTLAYSMKRIGNLLEVDRMAKRHYQNIMEAIK